MSAASLGAGLALRSGIIARSERGVEPSVESRVPDRRLRAVGKEDGPQGILQPDLGESSGEARRVPPCAATLRVLPQLCLFATEERNKGG